MAAHSVPGFKFGRVVRVIFPGIYGIMIPSLNDAWRLQPNAGSTDYEWTSRHSDAGFDSPGTFNCFWAGAYVDAKHPVTGADIRKPTKFVGYLGLVNGHFKRPDQPNNFTTSLLFNNTAHNCSMGAVCGAAIATIDGVDYFVVAVHNAAGGHIRFGKATVDSILYTPGATFTEFATVNYHATSVLDSSLMGLVSFSGDASKAAFLDDTNLIYPTAHSKPGFGGDTFQGRGYGSGKTNASVLYEITFTAAFDGASVVYTPESAPQYTKTLVANEYEHYILDYERLIAVGYVDNTLKRLTQRCEVDSQRSRVFTTDKTYTPAPPYYITDNESYTFQALVDATWTLGLPTGDAVYDASFNATLEAHYSEWYQTVPPYPGTDDANFSEGHVESSNEYTCTGWYPMMFDSFVDLSDTATSRYGFSIGRMPLWHYVDFYNDVYAYSLIGNAVVDTPQSLTEGFYPAQLGVTQNDRQEKRWLNYNQLELQIEQHIHDAAATDPDTAPEDANTSTIERTFAVTYPDPLRTYPVDELDGIGIFAFIGGATGNPDVSDQVEPIDVFVDAVYAYGTGLTQYTNGTVSLGGTVLQDRYGLPDRYYSTGSFKYLAWTYDIGTRTIQYATNSLYGDVVGNEAYYVYNR